MGVCCDFMRCRHNFSQKNPRCFNRGFLSFGDSRSNNCSTILHFDFSRFGDKTVAHAFQHFKNFAPCGKLSPAFAFVEIHGLHELDLFTAIISLTGRGIDLSSSFAFSTTLLPAIITVEFYRIIVASATISNSPSFVFFNTAFDFQLFFDCRFPDHIHFLQGGSNWSVPSVLISFLTATTIPFASTRYSQISSSKFEIQISCDSDPSKYQRPIEKNLPVKYDTTLGIGQKITVIEPGKCGQSDMVLG